MTQLLSDLLNISAPRGRIPVSVRDGPQLIGSADSNTLVMSEDTSAVTWVLDNAAALGTCVRIVQGDVGTITLAPATGAQYLQALGFHTSGGEDCEIVATVVANPDGATATWLVSGAMQSP